MLHMASCPCSERLEQQPELVFGPAMADRCLAPGSARYQSFRRRDRVRLRVTWRIPSASGEIVSDGKRPPAGSTSRISPGPSRCRSDNVLALQIRSSRLLTDRPSTLPKSRVAQRTQTVAVELAPDHLPVAEDQRRRTVPWLLLLTCASK